MKDEKLLQIKKQYSCKKPCANCPFRNDENAFQGLAAGRTKEIIDGLASGEAGTFHCHKTTHAKSRMDRKHCAGAMVVTLKNGYMPEIMVAGIAFGYIEPDHYDEAKPLTVEYSELLHG